MLPYQYSTTSEHFPGLALDNFRHIIRGIIINITGVFRFQYYIDIRRFIISKEYATTKLEININRLSHFKIATSKPGIGGSEYFIIHFCFFMARRHVVLIMEK
jgi:hypothetical protein